MLRIGGDSAGLSINHYIPTYTYTTRFSIRLDVPTRTRTKVSSAP